MENRLEEDVILKERKNYVYAADQAKVPDPLRERPCYRLPENATEDDARAMAIRAFEDMVTVRWTPVQDVRYQKFTNGRFKTYELFSNQAYAGLPYNDAGKSLFHMLEHYDPDTGVVHGLDFDDCNHTFGNSCATAVNWALSTVCPSLTANSTARITPAFGYAFFGEVEPLPWIHMDRPDQGPRTTENIIEHMDEQALYRTYAAMKPADVVITKGSHMSGEHEMMCYALPEVHYLPDGSIDGNASMLRIIDQHQEEREWTFNGHVYQIRGHVDKPFSFAELRKNHYLPMRPRDFKNWRGPLPAQAWFTCPVKTPEDLKKARIFTNYRVVKFEGALVGETGATLYRVKKMTENNDYYVAADRDQAAEALYPDLQAWKEVLKPGRQYFYEIRVLIANGETLVAGRIPVNTEG